MVFQKCFIFGKFLVFHLIWYFAKIDKFYGSLFGNFQIYLSHLFCAFFSCLQTESAYQFILEEIVSARSNGWIGIKSGGQNSKHYYYQSDEQTPITPIRAPISSEPNSSKIFCILIIFGRLYRVDCAKKFPYVCQQAGNNFSGYHHFVQSCLERQTGSMLYPWYEATCCTMGRLCPFSVPEM